MSTLWNHARRASKQLWANYLIKEALLAGKTVYRVKLVDGEVVYEHIKPEEFLNEKGEIK